MRVKVKTLVIWLLVVALGITGASWMAGEQARKKISELEKSVVQLEKEITDEKETVRGLRETLETSRYNDCRVEPQAEFSIRMPSEFTELSESGREISGYQVNGCKLRTSVEVNEFTFKSGDKTEVSDEELPGSKKVKTAGGSVWVYKRERDSDEAETQVEKAERGVKALQSAAIDRAAIRDELKLKFQVNAHWLKQLGYYAEATSKKGVDYYMYSVPGDKTTIVIYSDYDILATAVALSLQEG